MGDENGDRRGLTSRILVGMAAGVAVGVGLNLAGVDGFVGEYIVDGALYIGGKVFLASLKLLVVPLVFVSLVCGTAALDDVSKLGRVGWPYRVRAPSSPTALGRWKIQFCQAESRPKILVSRVSGPAKRRLASMPVSAPASRPTR